MSDAPKSAYELAIERLKKKDAEAGIVEQKLTDEQKAAILHRDRRLTTFDPAELEKMDEEYRRDMDRFASDRDAKIRRIRETAK